MSVCDKLNMVRDYALGELPGAERGTVERHLAGCTECASELDQLRLTTAALRMLPDQEIPQRIAFVSDKVFEPSRAARLFGGFRNSAAWGFASACVIAAALIVSAYHRPAVEVRTVVAESHAPLDVTEQINAAVTKAVAQARTEDAQLTRAALLEADRKRDQEHRAVMEAISVLEERQNTSVLLAANDSIRTGAGQ